MAPSTHENFSRDDTTTVGSDRSFGYVMAAAFACVTLLNWWHDGRVWPWTAGLVVFFFVAALLCPTLLRPFNRVWFKFGLLLHKIVNPIVMGILYYSTVVPTGLVMRLMGKDPLRLKRQPDVASYWIVRQPPGPAPETMKDQF